MYTVMSAQVLLGAFTKFRTATVCPSVVAHGTTDFHDV